MMHFLSELSLKIKYLDTNKAFFLCALGESIKSVNSSSSKCNSFILNKNIEFYKLKLHSAVVWFNQIV